MIAPIPTNESARLAALRSFDVVGTTPETDFDDLALIASQITGTPMASVSFVESDHLWFKGRVGVTNSEMPRDIALCSHTLLQPDLMVVKDAREDHRFADSPLVIGEPHVRFYAGMPLITSDGFAIGTLCVIDREPRELTPQQADALRALARQVVTQLELRRTRAMLDSTVSESRQKEERLRESEEFKTRLIETSRDCIKVLDLEGRLLSMNAGGREVLEICDFDAVCGSVWEEFWQGRDREACHTALEAARRGGTGRFVGFFPTVETKKPMWWDVVVSAIKGTDGKPERLMAVSRDVTQGRYAEELLTAITGGTVAVTGKEFFRSLVQHVAKALHVRYAFVAECLPNRRARSLAFWAGNDFGADFDYDLPGTPCMNVVQGESCHYREGLQQLFPEDDVLVDMKAQSYLGVPLFSTERQVIGHLVIIDDKPMPGDPLAISVLEAFAARAGAELQRQQADVQVRRLSDEREAMLNVNRAVARHLERNELFGALAGCLRNIFETDRFGIELPLAGNRLQGHLLTPGAAGVQSTRVKVLPADGTACNWVLQNREWLVSSTCDELRERFPLTFDVMAQEGMESLCAIPLVSDDRACGVLFFMAAARDAYAHLRRGLLEQVSNAVAVALDDCLAHEEVRRLRDRLAAENAYLQEEIRSEHNFEEIVGRSPALLAVLRQVDQVARTDATVLISGETGTGKELIARAIHNASGRKDRPLVKVNCAAISAGLVESELFGHMKGAFTGAIDRRTGRFELANGGTIFLDEVGELPLDTQVKLLRVLQEQEFEPVGSSKTVSVDVRIITATNRNLQEAVRNGYFREDLYYRLNVFPILVPPLRERAEDVAVLAMFFLTQFAQRFDKKIDGISQDAMAQLTSYSWPGNIRELQNIIERAVVLCQTRELALGTELSPAAQSGNGSGRARAAVAGARMPGDASPGQPSQPLSLEEVERRHVLTVLEQTSWVIDGQNGAARTLNLHPNTLRSRLKKLGIHRPPNDIS
ncbi:MAG: sigma 54-interacting transcriptional regulator [Pyrinomonadaceae bacterium]